MFGREKRRRRRSCLLMFAAVGSVRVHASPKLSLPRYLARLTRRDHWWVLASVFFFLHRKCPFAMRGRSPAPNGSRGTVCRFAARHDAATTPSRLAGRSVRAHAARMLAKSVVPAPNPCVRRHLPPSRPPRRSFGPERAPTAIKNVEIEVELNNFHAFSTLPHT